MESILPLKPPPAPHCWRRKYKILNFTAGPFMLWMQYLLLACVSAPPSPYAPIPVKSHGDLLDYIVR